jgi:hypothetical protein
LPAPESDFLGVLATFSRHGVEFIIVGGVCGVLHGAPISTFDLDVVHARTPENVERLLRALEELQAFVRGPGGSGRTPGRSHLLSAGHQLLLTRCGPLDLLGAIGRDRDYARLLSRSQVIQLRPDLSVRVLDLDALIEVKEETARDKDLAVLAILKRTLEERSRR